MEIENQLRDYIHIWKGVKKYQEKHLKNIKKNIKKINRNYIICYNQTMK